MRASRESIVPSSMEGAGRGKAAPRRSGHGHNTHSPPLNKGGPLLPTQPSPHNTLSPGESPITHASATSQGSPSLMGHRGHGETPLGSGCKGGNRRAVLTNRPTPPADWSQP
jgi:hypothetical protein